MNTQLFVYIALGLAAIVYAIILNTKNGRKFTNEFTWASVVIGTSIVLVALWFLIPQDNWQKIVLSFVIAGSPMIIRSLINKKKNS